MDYQNYLEFLREGDRSPRTIEDYGNTFKRYFAANAELTEPGVRSFLNGGNKSATTRAKERAQLKALCDFEDVRINFKRRIAQPKIVKNDPVVIAPDHQELLINFIQARLGTTYRRIFIFMLETGLRISEVASLTPASYRYTQGEDGNTYHYVRIDKKPGVTHSADGRNVPLSNRAYRIVEKVGLPFVFERRKLNRAIVQARRKYNLPHITPHATRRTFHTRMLGKIAPHDLANIMGHKNLTTGLAYTDRSPERLVTIFAGVA